MSILSSSSMLLLAIVALLVSPFLFVQSQTCLDESGNSVDWYMIVKLPKRPSSDAGVSTGTGYMYGDANSYASPSAFWSASPHLISDVTSAAGATLQQVYNAASNANQGYIFYNDELPAGSTSMAYGHSKGQLAWNAQSNNGFWLIHSVPKFADSPANTNTYLYPTNGHTYGQSMVCVSLGIPEVDVAFGQFAYTNPQVYGNQFVSALAGSMPNGVAFTSGGSVVTSSASNIANVTTLAGMSFTHFAKTVAWGQSIYSNLIGQYYATDMVVETWQRPYEAPLLPPATDTSVYSVRTLNSGVQFSGAAVGWTEGEDHAKWGISADKSNALICVGDINKQQSQWARSGGMLCIEDATINAAWAGLIVTTDQNSEVEMDTVATE